MFRLQNSIDAFVVVLRFSFRVSQECKAKMIKVQDAYNVLAIYKAPGPPGILLAVVGRLPHPGIRDDLIFFLELDDCGI